MFYRSLELITINLIDKVNLLQLLRTGLQRLLVSDDISVIRRCISNVNVEIDCDLSLARPKATELCVRERDICTYML